VLILIYAILILGGSGSLWGVILGAVVLNVSLEVLRTPNHATIVFLTLIVATLLAKLRPWRVLAGVVAGTVVLGFAFRAVVGAIWPATLHAQGAVTGWLGEVLSAWLPVSTNYKVGNWVFLLVIGLVCVMTIVPRFWRNVLLMPTLVLAVFNWNSRLAFEPSITRLISIGIILIVLMNARPQGLVGANRVEIV
jgi:ABC-type branched-subunit amino acid transport system permease subunit